MKYAGILVTILISSYSFGNNNNSYLNESQPFLLIKDVNRQAEAWGTCSAIYDVMAMLLTESNPAQAKQYKDFGNGASIAVLMTHVSDGLKPDMSSEQFNSLWSLSKILSNSIPETKRTMILADGEMLGKTGSEKFIEKVATTAKICMENLEGQQIRIDAWRDLAKSGLLSMPNK